MNTKLKNRFRNRYKMIPIKNGGVHFRADYNAKDFKASVVCSLAKFEKLNNQQNLNKSLKDAVDKAAEFQEWYAGTGGIIENEEMEFVIEKFK